MLNIPARLFFLFHLHLFFLPLLPRCAVGDDWWYYGNNCQFKGSVKDKTNLALATSLSVLGVMLVITLITVFCMKKKYKKRIDDSGVVMANMYSTDKL